jgi:hypothetical protein
MTVKRFEIFEEESAILKRIAGQYSHDSKEYLAIEHAAFALASVTQEFDAFAAFIRDCSSELTDEQKAQKRSLGLEI